MTPARSPLRAALLAVIAVGLVLIGGGAAVGLGLGRGEPAPTADSVAAGFARDMSRHHLQGVEMANLAPERSTDPEVRQLAFDIAETQQNQVGRMQGWLALWGLPPTGGDTMAWMASAEGHGGHDTGAADGGLMPGMATDEELARLRDLSGTGFDVEFLRLMIRHHQGGFEMAQYAAEHAGVPAVAGLAGTIAETQAAEVTTMERMLTARGGTPLPAP
ncbi:DUF305 domain-containing protein [Geodermatophilus poikilotrophus]|uniref:Uncharacterized conserved protein, DUF305 family n=1 Tax=Geodermatophilus poikilotrophus TaxID=1333667 RepID=A0A1I0FX33_9ACTN|nr:DUF305 domain-containing protein [Geodermatophilus poikilotrophus]SET62056.1 Uncharacterized conserved protein, DUF305 family [Geodermatophilus poikilotrophus]